MKGRVPLQEDVLCARHVRPALAAPDRVGKPLGTVFTRYKMLAGQEQDLSRGVPADYALHAVSVRFFEACDQVTGWLLGAGKGILEDRMHVSRLLLQKLPRVPEEGNLYDSRRALALREILHVFWVDAVVWAFVVFFSRSCPFSP